MIAMTESTESPLVSMISKDLPLDHQQIAPESYAFLVHSQDTLNHNLPPDVDNAPLARQKRRRTSPEDQNILESAYSHNPKPDKAARMLIVNRVALGEKEVQIWFQNRRQMTRRKAQPLSEYEIMSNIRSSQDSLDSFPGSSFSTVENNEYYESSTQNTLFPSQPVSNDDHRTTSGLDPKMLIVSGNEFEPNLLALKKTIPAIDIDHLQNVNRNVDTKKPEDTTQFVEQIHPASASKPVLLPIPRPKEMPGYLANRRSASFAMHQEEDHADPFVSSSSKNVEQPITSITIPSVPIKHTSVIRLSLSLDGKARVVAESDDSPSPPRTWSPKGFNFEKRPGGGLQRSHSAVLPHELPSVVPKLPSLVPRRSIAGRSRDARTWEFYCDSEAGNALNAQAEFEKSGSAVGPIGLIRSGSIKAMVPNPHKRNATVQKFDLLKKHKSESQSAVKPKLGRAVSSVARLQNINGNEQRVVANTPRKDPKRKLPSMIFEDEDWDSDKENWEPGTQQRSVQRRRPVQPQGLRREVLGESPAIPSHSSSLQSLLNREDSSPRSSRHKKKPLGDAGQGSVHAKVYGNVKDIGQVSSLSRAVEDLEGVQNLLSLSKATWF